MNLRRIKESEILENGVCALPDKPSTPSPYGGRSLSAGELKAAFDRLPRLIAERYNALLDSLGLEGEEDTLSALIATGLGEGHSLAELFQDIKSGNFAAYLETGDGSLYDRIALLVGKRTPEGGEVFNTYEGGEANQAAGRGSHAGGEGTEVTPEGENAFAHGKGLLAKGPAQAVFGRYNAPDPSALWLVGLGTSEEDRRTLLALGRDGHFVLSGEKQEWCGEHDRNETAHPALRQRIEEVRTLALGAARGHVFPDYTALDALCGSGDLSSPEETKQQFLLGDAIYFTDTTCPDLWVSGFADTFLPAASQPFSPPGPGETVQAGWLLLSPLEGAKLDLSGFYTKEEIHDLFRGEATLRESQLQDATAPLAKRLENLEEAVASSLFLSVSENAPAVTVPQEALPYAEVVSLGGRSLRNAEENILLHGRITALTSYDTQGAVIDTLSLPPQITSLPDWGMGIWDEKKGILHANELCWQPEEGILQYVRRVRLFSLTGREDYLPLDYGEELDCICYSCSALTNYTEELTPILSPEFTSVIDGYWIGNMFLHCGYGRLRIFVSRAEFPTRDSFVAYVKSRYQAGDPLTALAILKEPEITDLTGLLPGDNLIKVAPGGTVVLEGAEGLQVPSTLIYMKKEESDL